MSKNLIDCVEKAAEILSPEDKQFLMDQIEAGVPTFDILDAIDSDINQEMQEITELAGVSTEPTILFQSESESSEYDAAVAKGLPMDKASRMERAKQQGYEGGYYHGTKSAVNFKEFKPGVGGAIFVTKNKPTANEFSGIRIVDKKPVAAKHGRVLPLMVSINKTFDYNKIPREQESSLRQFLDGRPGYPQHKIDETLSNIKAGDWDVVESTAVQGWIKSEGFDSYVVQENGIDNIGVYDPSDVRSVNAAFDPELQDSENMLNQDNRGQIMLKGEERIIQLLADSDATTFIHESSHLFLEMEKFYAKKYGLSEDQKTIIKWLGVESFDDITTEQHEKWAESFEAYVFKGEAPSIELRRAFSAFARWMKTLYKTLTNPALSRADVTPEIKEVFDRLLATQEQIEQVAANPQYDQFFRSKEQAGMTDAEWTKYLARAARVRNSAEMTVDEKAIKQYRRMKSKEWNDEKKPLIEQYEQELSKERVYQVLSDLTSYTDRDGGIIEARLDTDMLKEAIGQDNISGKLIGKHVKKNGLDPALVSESYGYSSVRQMYDEIVESPSLKQATEAAAQEEMVSRHGDILNDGSLEQEVIEALTNESQAEMLMMEINALGRKNRQPSVNRELLKSQATIMIGQMRYSEIKPGKYYRAMTKAAQNAVRSEDPTAAKTQQLVNHYLYKEALAVREKMTKNRAKVKKAQTRKYDTNKVDAGYAQQIKMLSNMYEMRQSPQQLVELDTILNFYAAQQRNAEGELNDLSLLDPQLVKALNHRDNTGSLQGFELIPFEDLTADDLQGVVDMIDHLRYVGGQLAELNGEEAIRERLELADSIRTKGGADQKQQRGRQRAGESAKREWNYIFNTLPSLANMVRKLDGNEGGGKAFESIYQTVVGAENTKFEMNKEFYDTFSDMMGEVSKVNLSRGDSKKFTLESGRVEEFSSEERFMMALYWGTESSRDAIKDAWGGMTDTDVVNILSTLTPEQLELVNTTWAMNETHWSDLAKAAIAMEGVAPPKLKATPFTVNGVQLTGGHMQLFYDSQRIELANEQEQGGSYSSVMPTKAGSLNARVGSGGEPPLLDIGSITRSIDDKIHYIAYAKAGRKLRRLVNSNDVKAVIERKHGVGFYKAFVESIQGVTGGRSAQESHSGFAKANRWMRQSATMMHLAYSIRNTVQQVGAVPIAIAEVGAVNFANASAQLLTQKGKYVAEVNSKSKFMENRAQVINRDSREFMKQLIATSEIGHMWEKFKAHGFIMQTVVDSTIAYPTWLAAYNKSMDEHGDEKRAVTEADTSVAQSVGSGSDLHLGRIMQSSQSEGIKTLTVFGSWFNAYYQRLYKSSRGGTSFANMGFVTDAFILPFIVANITQALILDTPDDDEELEEYLFGNTAKFMAGTIPVMREIASISEGFTPTTPINQLPASLFRLPQEFGSFAKGNQSGLKTTSDLGKAVTGFTKVPGSGQLWRAMDYIDSYIEGNEGDTFNPYQMLTEGADKDDN